MLQDFISDSKSQSLGLFEFIIVNDSSTDSSLSILQSFQRKENRIIIINNQQNLGLGSSLQIGIAHAQSEFIARMDADDVSTLDRFQRQMDYLEAHPEILILGGDHILIDKFGNKISDLIYPKDPVLIRWNMLLRALDIHLSLTRSSVVAIL